MPTSNEPVSTDQFKQGMRRLAGAVNIVTTAAGNIQAGLTATAVTSLSAEPPRLLVCVNRDGMTYETISRGRILGVNVLEVEHRDLAMQFAGMGNLAETDRFLDDIWIKGATGAPLLKTALAAFDCEVENIMDVGSHGIVVGNIIDIRTQPDKQAMPLCYIDGQWAGLSPL